MSSGLLQIFQKNLAGLTTSFVLEVYVVERIKSQILLKRNLKAILKHRGKTQADLARHLAGRDKKHADSWLSHILDEDDLQRELPMELWDKAAEFLGVDTYCFFIPGIANEWTLERRAGGDRRVRADRRLGTALPARPRDIEVMNLIRSLPYRCIDEAIEGVMKILDRELRRRPARPTSAGGPESTDETDATIHVQGHRKGKR